MKSFIGILSASLMITAAHADEKFWEWIPDRITPERHAARREQLRSMLADGGYSVVFTNPEQVRNNDVDFQFRADSNFLYLTGMSEPDSVLFLAKDGIEFKGRMVKEIMFCNDRNPGAERWLGYRFGPERAAQVLKIEAVASNNDWNAFVASLPLKLEKTAILAPEPELAGRKLGGMIKTWDTWLQANAPRVTLERRQARTFGTMRWIKDAEEIRLMKQACAISAESHNEVMRNCKPNMREYQMSALMEYGFKKNGCEYLGYGNIVGSGPNSCILHYMQNEKEMKSGELLLMDCGGEYHGYTADVTRTIPINGKFTPAQKAIYEVVLEAQEAGIKACVNGASFGAGHQAASAVMAKGLVKLGIIAKESELGRYFMHGTSHALGLDVHDAMPANSTLRPGAVLTVEPGIYISEGSPCDPKWWNIGVRIEDDILVTEKGPLNLSAGAPRTVAAVEAMMRSKRK